MTKCTFSAGQRRRASDNDDEGDVVKHDVSSGSIDLIKSEQGNILYIQNIISQSFFLSGGRKRRQPQVLTGKIAIR